MVIVEQLNYAAIITVQNYLPVKITKRGVMLLAGFYVYSRFLCLLLILKC